MVESPYNNDDDDGPLWNARACTGTRFSFTVRFDTAPAAAPSVTPEREAGAVALHPVCSAVRMDLAAKLKRVAEACSERAEVPITAGCCGFAGDRGFTAPELTAAATRAEAAEVATGRFSGFYSSSRTCEIGLARATGQQVLETPPAAGLHKAASKVRSMLMMIAWLHARMGPWPRAALAVVDLRRFSVLLFGAPRL